jgi:hypothetical protein
MADDLIDIEELLGDYSPTYVEAYLMERVSGQSIEGEFFFTQVSHSVSH